MVIATLLSSLSEIFSMLLNFYIWIIIIASVLNLVQPNLNHPIITTLNRLTLPIYAKLRKILPCVIGQVDLSPLILIIFLKFVDLFFIKILSNIASNLNF